MFLIAPFLLVHLLRFEFAFGFVLFLACSLFHCIRLLSILRFFFIFSFPVNIIFILPATKSHYTENIISTMSIDACRKALSSKRAREIELLTTHTHWLKYLKNCHSKRKSMVKAVTASSKHVTTFNVHRKNKSKKKIHFSSNSN